MAKVKVIKANLDLMRLPGVKLFMDSHNQEWIMIPSVPSQDYQANGKNITKNPCRIWSSQVKEGKDEGAEKRILNVDIVPYIGNHPEWGHSHLIKFYKNDPNIDKWDSAKQNVILGNCKEQDVEWKDNYDATTNHNRQAYDESKAKAYMQQYANKPQYGPSNEVKNESGTSNQPEGDLPF